MALAAIGEANTAQKKATREYFVRIDASRPDLFDLFTADFQFYFPKFGVGRGRAEFEILAGGLIGTFRSFAHDLDSFRYIEEKHFVAVEGRTHGTTSGGSKWCGGETSGGRFSSIFEFCDGLIARMHIYLDPDYAGEDTERFNALPGIPSNLSGRLSGKTALITGGGRGIGRATAELFAQEGAAVFAADLEHGDPYTSPAIHFLALDVGSESHWVAAMAEVTALHGGVDVLVNNAGIAGSQKAILDEDLDSWDRVVSVNQTGVFLGMRAVLPTMRANKRGSIINISSIWGIGAVPIAAAYQASKAAVRHITKHAAIAYGPDNVRVNSVHPGIVDTPLVQAQSGESNAQVVARTPLGRMARPSEIAHALLFLASDESSFVTGAELYVDGGYLA